MHIESVERGSGIKHRMQTIPCFLMQTIPCFLAIGCGKREKVDGLNLLGGGTTLACPEWCEGLSWEDAV